MSVQTNEVEQVDIIAAEETDDDCEDGDEKTNQYKEKNQVTASIPCFKLMMSCWPQ